MPNTESSAQAETVRKIAEQLFETWKLQQAREAKESRRWFGSNFSGWLAASVVIIGGIVAGANTHDLATDANARSLRNEVAITTMRVDNSDRLARIETKIDQLVKDSSR